MIPLIFARPNESFARIIPRLAVAATVGICSCLPVENDTFPLIAMPVPPASFINPRVAPQKRSIRVSRGRGLMSDGLCGTTRDSGAESTGESDKKVRQIFLDRC